MSTALVSYSGYFGKFPGYRDFVQHGLDANRVDSLLNWIAGFMDAGAERYGNEWLEIYLHSPVWRYFCPDSEKTQTVLIGAVMPSLDARGRYFPLVVEWSVKGAVSLFQFEKLQSFFDELENVMLATLSEPYVAIEDFQAHFEDFFSTNSPHNAMNSDARSELSDPWLNSAFGAVEDALTSTKNRLGIWQSIFNPPTQPILRLIDGWPSAQEFVSLQKQAMDSIPTEAPTKTATEIKTATKTVEKCHR